MSFLYSGNNKKSAFQSTSNNNDDNDAFLDNFLDDDDFSTENDSLPPAPTSLLSNNLPHSLLQGNRSAQHIPSARPRSQWTIRDSSLQHIPQFYPPMNPNCTIYVANTPPSIVAVRITECLRKRSIAVEYDDDSITATAMTIDRCHFQIQLWRGKITPSIDFSNGVVVECIRIRGDTMSFHHACIAILQAANGESTGEDRRNLRQTNCMEFQKLKKCPKHKSQQLPEDSPSSLTRYRLEQVQDLLRKDRLECQQLGMERLIHLTTSSSCGDRIAISVSRIILQESWFYPYLYNETEMEGITNSKPSPLTRPGMIQRAYSSTSSPSSQQDVLDLCVNEIQHSSKMQACALRVFCNALSNLSNSSLLSEMLDSSDCALIHSKLLDSLTDILKGATRPPSVIESGILASMHETSLAIRCLCILGEHSDAAKLFLQSDTLLERLEIARSCGRTSHLTLQQETDQIYSKLTEDSRSC